MLNQILRDLIFVLIGAVTLAALVVSAQLRRKALPTLLWVRSSLKHWAHQNEATPELQSIRPVLVERCRQSFLMALGRSDQPPCLDLVSVQIESETIRLPVGRPMTLPEADRLVRACPGMLVSLGLLGTFLGLTLSLGDLSPLLRQGGNVQELLPAFGQIVAPMGTAFQTSLAGLSMAILITLCGQLLRINRVSEDLLELLQAWLEAVVRSEPDAPRYSPVAEAMDNLKVTMELFTQDFGQTLRSSIDAALRSKLDEVFSSTTLLVQEGQRVMQQLNGVTLTMAEAGADFVTASQALGSSRFATELNDVVRGLFQSGEQFTAIADGLADRITHLRESLVEIQSQWQTLAITAQAELESSRRGQEAVVAGIATLRQANEDLRGGLRVSEDSTKQLKETRLEVMRDRKLAESLATDLQKRLSADSELTLAYSAITRGLQRALDGWEEERSELDRLGRSFREALQKDFEERNGQLESISRTYQEQFLLEFRKGNERLEAQKAAIDVIIESGFQAMSERIIDRLKPIMKSVESQLLRMEAKDRNGATFRDS